MVKRKVAWPKPSHNNMEVQSGVNQTSMTLSSQIHELKTSSITDHDAMTNPPLMGGGSEAGAQESPSTSNVELEYNTVLPDKGKRKAVPDNTAQGGSGHDPPREWERMSHLLRWNESDDHLQSHPMCHHPTTTSDNKEILDRLLPRMDEIVRDSDEAMAEVMRRVEEIHVNMWNSVVDWHQCVKVWKERHSKWDVETSRSLDGWSQTCHTRDDKLGLSHWKYLHPAQEGRKQDGQVHHPSNEPDDRSQRLSPQNSQRNLDEETLVDVMAKLWWEAKRWEESENDAAKHHRKALDYVIQAAEEVVEYAKTNNLLRQEVIDTENELEKAVQAKNSCYRVQKVGLNAEARITSQTTRPVDPRSIQWWT